MFRSRLRILAALAVLAAIVPAALALRTGSSSAGALGGPVIIGGDDLTDHGCVDGGGNVEEGWVYIKNALDAIDGETSRGDGSIAALGSDSSEETNCSDAGAAIGAAAEELGISVDYYNGAAAINGFFSGSSNPSIIWIAGDGALNDLESDEAQALTDNAEAIAAFVAGGGGLLSHGSEFGWLFALLPDLTAVDDGSSDDLYITSDGAAAMPGLSVGDINAGPWHNYFDGDLGGLAALARSGDIDDSAGEDAAVIIGGRQVTFEGGGPTPEPTDCIAGIPGSRCGTDGGGGGGGEGTNGTPAADTATAVPAATATMAPPAVLPTAPGGGAGGGGIIPPDTGSGGQAAAANGYGVAAMLLVLAGAAVFGSTLALRRQ